MTCFVYHVHVRAVTWYAFSGDRWRFKSLSVGVGGRGQLYSRRREHVRVRGEEGGLVDLGKAGINKTRQEKDKVQLHLPFLRYKAVSVNSENLINKPAFSVTDKLAF